MKSFVELKCQQCNATLSVEADREMLFCTYCGNKILLNDENKHTIHYVDEADIKRAETERMIQLKELELDEKRRSKKKKEIIIWLLVIVGLVILGFSEFPICFFVAPIVWFIGMLIFFGDNEKKKKPVRIVYENEIQISNSLCHYREKHYETVSGYYKTAGFVNVSTIPLHDLGLLEFKRNGLVKEITIGDDEFEEGDIFKKTSPVVITYHSTK